MTDWLRFSNPLKTTEEIFESDDLDAILAEQERINAEKGEFGDLVWAEFERTGIVVLPADKDTAMTRVSLTRSTYPGVKYQVTRWDERGPVGHQDASSRKVAIDELWYYVGRMGRWRERWERRRR